MNSLTQNLQAFYSKLRSDDLEQELNQYIINDIVLINRDIVEWDFRVIKNVVFKERVDIERVEIQNGIYFVNCEFKNGIYFNNVRATSFDSEKNTSNCNVLFSYCQLTNVVFSKLCRFERGVFFENCKKIERIYLSNTTIGNGGLKMNNCVLNDLFHLFAVNGEIAITGCQLRDGIRFESTTGNFSAINNVFKDDVKFWNITCSRSFTLNRNIFEDTFDIKSSRIKNFKRSQYSRRYFSQKRSN